MANRDPEVLLGFFTTLMTRIVAQSPDRELTVLALALQPVADTDPIFAAWLQIVRQELRLRRLVETGARLR